MLNRKTNNIEIDYDYLADLVKKVQRGNSEAFAELYTATYKKQYKYTYQYVRDEQLAQDILQDVYILALKNIHSLKNPRLFVSWLNQIDFRVCYDAYNQYKKQQDAMISIDQYDFLADLASRQSLEKKVMESISNQELNALILALPPKQGQAIIMKYYNDMELEEIAEALDCSRSTVKRLLKKGKAELQKKIINERSDSL